MRLAPDSNILTYHWQANQAAYDPSADPDQSLAPQRVAAFRLSLYSPIRPIVVPTVMKEIEAIRDQQKHVGHFNLAAYDLDELQAADLNEGRVSERAELFALRHSGPKKANDCRIVAECEEAAYLAEGSAIDAFVTLDSTLANALRDCANVAILTPVEAWERLAIQPGAAPVWTPAEGHPLRHASWWRA